MLQLYLVFVKNSHILQLIFVVYLLSFLQMILLCFPVIYDTIYLLQNSDETKDCKKTNKIPLKEENYLFLDIY
jgi:hypothetical protein